ncbi:molybdate ABC transporter substrate-binding protein [Inquilinus sp. YAF38]|uniref:molybdate ABC transporter substrate-binding protein n=1 Tax=Inquilinus sp. YAF38 TaxID=3233084 RepID=UPI003F8F03AC
MRRLAAVVIGCMLLAVPAAAADPALTLYGAGSLRGAMLRITEAYRQSGGAEVTVSFGPSGTMREKIEAGDKVDIFTSADTGHPQRLNQEGLGRPLVVFARNRLCAIAAPRVGLTADNVLDRALDPAVRLGTSTPKSDPSGDYTWAMFRKAEAIRPGAFAALDGKALQLVGAPDSARKLGLPEDANAAAWLIEHDKADMFLGYCTSGKAAQAERPDLVVVPLPKELAVGAAYGLTVLKDAPPEAYRLALFILSPAGQAILAESGFDTPTTP